ncbi:MAG: hypothetical protein ACK52V_06485 [Betaproteobacteria bacterium]
MLLRMRLKALGRFLKGRQWFRPLSSVLIDPSAIQQSLAWYSVGMASSLSPETRQRIADAWPGILQAIRDGERADKTCAAHGFSPAQVWLFRNAAPELRAAWQDAMKDSADAFFNRAIAAAENAAENPKAARVMLAAYQWAAEKRDPDKYGQRTRADINVKTVDLTGIIADANARLIAARQHRVIDVTPSNCGAGEARAHALPAINAAIAQAADLF